MSPRLILARLGKFARTRAGLPVLILAAAVAVVALLTATRPRLEPVASAERVWTVNAISVRHETLQPGLDLFGEVVAGRRSELRVLVAGPIARVGANFRDGGVVARGRIAAAGRSRSTTRPRWPTIARS